MLSLLPAGANGRPKYGEGARFCSLGPDWEDGDVIEAEMPMRFSVEDLNDDRAEMQALKAVMMGPLLMAGGCAGAHPMVLGPVFNAAGSGLN
jgi:hypothetical protein